MTHRTGKNTARAKNTAANTTGINAVLQVEKLVPGGDGMARLEDGSIAFVAGALPGERLVVSQMQHKKGFARAQAFQLLSPSPERIEPPCRYAKSCGGCDFMHIQAAAQLDYKAAMLDEALQRTGGFSERPQVIVHASPRALGYRIRLRVHLEQPGKVGFYAASTHQLVEVDTCLVATPELQDKLATFRRLVREQPQISEAFEEAELRIAPGRASCVLRLLPRQRHFTGRGERPSPGAGRTERKRLPEQLKELLDAHFEVSVEGETSAVGQIYSLAEHGELEVPASAFVQVNWELNQELVRHVVASALARNATHYLDLYAGVGNFSLPLARAGLTGVAVEAHGVAVEAARRLVSASGLRVELHAEPAESYVRRAARSSSPPRFDLIVLDPPRSGARELTEDLLALAAKHIAYCACDPVTLARDLKVLCAGGYRLTEIHAFDMFPATHHVETLAWLERSG